MLQTYQTRNSKKSYPLKIRARAELERRRRNRGNSDPQKDKADALKKYCPHDPTQKQQEFLESNSLEALYGGAAGGGKSDALLMGALQYVNQKGYAALLLRRTYADLSLPDALMPRLAEWLGPTDAKWSDKSKTWTFPSGATITFGYLQTLNDMYRYQSAAFQYIAFDELSQFPEQQYRYLFSRLRKSKESNIPLRMRAGSNPGGTGHKWVYRRFIAKSSLVEDGLKTFYPAKLDDNPYIDSDEYKKSLEELDEITKQQLLDGLWVADDTGLVFDDTWWKDKNRYHVDDHRQSNTVIGRWLFYDTAFKSKVSSDKSACSVFELLPDYRVRLRWAWLDKIDSAFIPQYIEEMAIQWNYDEKLKDIIIEDKGSGTTIIQTLRASFPQWISDRIGEFMPIGSKGYRAKQAAIHCARGCVLLPHVDATLPWYNEAIDPVNGELFQFTATEDHEYDDFTDTFVMGILYLENYLTQGYRARNNVKSI